LIKIIELKKLEQLEETSKLQEKIWRMGKEDVIPTHFLRAYIDVVTPFGIILGAYDSQTIVGCSFTFPSSKKDVYLLHMIGVLPHYQHQKIGKQLMEKTKALAKQRGIKKLILTYDPLESVNANLYINKQGGICRKYMRDYYRIENSKTHSGFPADRFQVELFIEESQKELELKKLNHNDMIEVTIPLNFQEEKNQDINFAIELRKKTRFILESYINEKNYIVTSFTLDKSKNMGIYTLFPLFK